MNYVFIHLSLHGQCRSKIGFKLLMRRNKILVLKCRVNPEAVGFTGIRACGR
jgi:hypothetical protein